MLESEIRRMDEFKAAIQPLLAEAPADLVTLHAGRGYINVVIAAQRSDLSRRGRYRDRPPRITLRAASYNDREGWHLKLTEENIPYGLFERRGAAKVPDPALQGILIE